MLTVITKRTSKKKRQSRTSPWRHFFYRRGVLSTTCQPRLERGRAGCTTVFPANRAALCSHTKPTSRHHIRKKQNRHTNFYSMVTMKELMAHKKGERKQFRTNMGTSKASLLCFVGKHHRSCAPTLFAISISLLLLSLSITAVASGAEGGQRVILKIREPSPENAQTRYNTRACCPSSPSSPFFPSPSVKNTSKIDSLL